MTSSQQYALVLDPQHDDIRFLTALFESLRCPMVIANSADQVMATINQSPPSLVILAGNPQTLSQTWVSDLRTIADLFGITLLALSDCNAPSWIHQDENPGFDGFLVKPISDDVLNSLVQSARVRQTCHLTN
jgi:CheY-like chemotaxis protein